MTRVIQTFDSRHPHVVAPAEIKSGDWLSDRGTLRQVASVDSLSVVVGPGMIYIVHFEEQPDVANKVLGISSQSPPLTVWRDGSA